MNSNQNNRISIEDVICARGYGGFFNDDQVAIGNGADRDGEFYLGQPVTPGFERIRVPAEALSIGLLLSDGSVAWGDAMSVQYAGASGRDQRFQAQAAAALIKDKLRDSIVELSLHNFRTAANTISDLRIDGQALHLGLQYGLTQALLQACAHAHRVPVALQVCNEYQLSNANLGAIPVYAQSGDLRKPNVDKMIMKKVDILPHGLINSPGAFGYRGEDFLEFVRWCGDRIKSKGDNGYSPKLYFDVYGMPGKSFDLQPERIVDYLAEVRSAAGDFPLIIESPANFGSQERQVEGFAEIRRLLSSKGIAVEIAIDEWCNTLADVEQFIAYDAVDMVQIKMPDLGGVDKSIEAVNLCKQHGVGAYLGGSCTETDLSARLSTQIAIATRADMLLAKPGMGVDEAVMITVNEQARTLALLARFNAT